MAARWLGIALALAGLPAAADAAISILGSSYGRECFIAAEASTRGPRPIETCSRALEDEALSADDRAATLVNRGILHMQAKDLPAAIADFDLAIVTRPEMAEAYVNKGIAVLQLGNRARDAVAMLTTGLSLNPAKPEIAYYVRGIANEQLGQTRDAYEDYSKAVALRPGWEAPIAELQRFTVRRRPTAGV